MENYIVINGKKAELTEEQLEKLGIEVQKKRNNPFNNTVENCMPYYANVGCEIDEYFSIDGVLKSQGLMRRQGQIHREDIEAANCFNDKRFAEQVLLHEILNRKLLKYAWNNNAEDGEWDGLNSHWHIEKCLTALIISVKG